MPENKDYSQSTIEELLTEEKKFKKQGIISAVIIGFLIGVLIFGIVKNGIGFLHIFFPAILIFAIYKNSQKSKEQYKQLQTEIKSRDAA